MAATHLDIEEQEMPQRPHDAAERQISMMEDVRGLMEWVRSAATSEGEGRITPHSKNCESAWRSPLACAPCPSEQAATAAIVAPVFSNGLDEREGVEPFCQSSFRRWVLSTIVMCVLLASTSMFVALDRSTNMIRSEAIDHCQTAMRRQTETVDQLVDKNVTAASFKATLRSMSVMVEELVKAPAGRAVSALDGSMKAARHLNSSWDGKTPQNRERLAYRAWVEMSRQWGLTDYVWAAANPRQNQEYVLRKAVDALGVLYLSGEVAGCEVRRREFSCPGAGAALCANTCTGWCTRLSVSVLDSPGSVNGSTVLTHEDVKHGRWEERHMTFKESHTPRAEPSLDVQVRQAERAALLPGGAEAAPVESLWSEVYFAERSLKLALSWTSPIAPCGNYSCLQGAIAAEVSLPRVSVDCATAWENLSQLLASAEYDFPIGDANSSLFVVHVDGPSDRQRGQLIGTSDAFPITSRVKAEDASQDVVRATSRAVLDKFSAWNASELLYSEQLFTFRRSSAMRGRFAECEPGLEEADCWQVGTLVVELDSRTRWLLVATLPAGAFNRKAASAAAEGRSRVQALSNSSHSYVNQARMTGVGIIFFIAAISISLGFGLGCAVSEPLQRLGDLMRLLSDLDWGTHSAELSSLSSENQRAHIQDISELQNAFCSLVLGIEAFAKFVPGTVVTRVIRGDRRATRLHVDRRDVTVMFCSIGNFKQVSKELTDEVLLQVMSRYHTVMTRVVERYEGAVAEILDDGLLVYYNTPDCVVHHAAKACEAALSQQRAAELLNAEFAEAGLPTLAAYIGIHTGNVLSGNIGTDRKMKFGCMGDGVNLASRLNGCCKYYGVGIVCSGATYAALPKGIGLVCRKLDLVRVKGRREPTPIYEIVGLEQRSAETWITPTYSVCSAGSSIRRTLTEQMARACSRSPALSLGRTCTSAAGFHVPGMQCLTPGARRVLSPSKANPFHLSPTADVATPSGDYGPSPFFQPAVAEGSRPPAARGDLVHTPSGGLGDEEAGEQDPQVPLRLPCLGSRGSLRLHKQGRRKSLQLPGDGLAAGEAPPTPGLLGRGANGAEPGATSILPSAGASPAAAPDDCVTPEQRESVRRYEEALQMFQQARFVEARNAAGALAEEQPGDLPTQMLFKRATLHVGLDGADRGGLTEDQLRSWTGETRLDQK